MRGITPVSIISPARNTAAEPAVMAAGETDAASVGQEIELAVTPKMVTPIALPPELAMGLAQPRHSRSVYPHWPTSLRKILIADGSLTENGFNAKNGSWSAASQLGDRPPPFKNRHPGRRASG